jgi:putative tryptophan/tyrosine transport system substrate-binding protein
MRRREFIAVLGGAALAPDLARTQVQAPAVIGYLTGTPEKGERTYTSSLHQGLNSQGFVEGRNIEIIFRSAEAHYDQLPMLASELVRRQVAVIFATGGAGAPLAAKAATTTIPIVFQLGADPVRIGLVPSLNRPGGNITGVTFLGQALVAKSLELLYEAAPVATTIAFFVNPTAVQVEADIKEAESAARVLGARLLIVKLAAAREFDGALAGILDQRIGAILTEADPLFADLGSKIATWAAQNGVLLMYPFRDPFILEDGPLMTYGASLFDTYRIAGGYIGRILKGEKPGDLPVQQSTNVELVLNLKTAKSLGLTFPVNLLGRADEVIE